MYKTVIKSKILRLLFEFESEFIGGRYISGNAFRHALGMQINVSMGILSELEWLIEPKSYLGFFEPRMKNVFTPPNVHPFFSKLKNRRDYIFYYTPKSVIFDFINPPENLLDKIQDMDFIQFGGGRNRGYGFVSLKDHIYINLSDIILPEEGTHITLISPILYPPKFVEKYKCRLGQEVIWNNGRKNTIRVIEPGQFFRLKEKADSKKVAIRGILRKCLFGKFGFGEFKVENWPKEVET